ncbi:MAG: nitric oxide reductase activation protein [Lachnospiraceae bacterium]|nr:nitric oxide reductase activation protein [Lachnospiraceae bacterium]
MSFIESGTFFESDLSGEPELLANAERRVRNLMWTVSGDYTLDTNPDVKSYAHSKYISLYDALRQGAFARFFDKNEFSLYLVKKIFCGADEQPLTDLAQLAVDAASFPRAAAERPGTTELRVRAFSDLLDHSFHKMSTSLPGRLKIAWIRSCLYGDMGGEKQIRESVSLLRSLENTDSTAAIIRVTDLLYNQLIDRSFEKKQGSLEKVLAVTLEDLREFDWGDFLKEEISEDDLEAYLKQMNQAVQTLSEEPDEKQEKPKEAKRKIIVIDEKAAAKMYSYMELNFGRSYLNAEEQKRRNARLCRGAHADCSLYYTEGILKNPVLSNAQYVNARRLVQKNELHFRNHYHSIVRSSEQLSDELRRTLHRRSEPETMNAYAGRIVPNRLWQIGRLNTPGPLFKKTQRHLSSDFAVDILIDASGSQRDRQSEIAMQAFIIAEALCQNQIPLQVSSFCTFWDYTVLQRFREYDAPRQENRQLLNYVTSSNNRDGLAFRAVGDSLLSRPEEGKILIVLSDGKPNDIIVNRPNSRNPRPYYGEYAIRDTAREVRALRASGVYVLGVFTGKESDLTAEKKIFGRDFTYIRSIRNFARVVAHYLRRLLEEDGAYF